MPIMKEHSRGVLLVALAGVFWSTSGLGVRYMQAANGWQIVFYRSLSLALFISFLIARRHYGKVLQNFRALGWTGFWGGCALAVAFTGMILGFQLTTVANVMFILSTSPFFSALLGWYFLGEKLRRITVLSMFAAWIGVSIMVLDGLGGKGWIGCLVALTMTVATSAYAVIARKGRKQNMFPSIVIGACLSMLISAFMMDGFAIPIGDMSLCFVLGVFQLGLGYATFTLGARYVPAAELQVLAMTEVVLNPLWVFIGVGERPSDLSLVGGFVVLTAVSLQAYHFAKSAKAEKVLT